MALPEVCQAQALSRLMSLALAEYTPASLAVIGCTTGNGFEHIDPIHTRRVVGIDINPDYLAILKSRFACKIPGLKLIEADTVPLKRGKSFFAGFYKKETTTGREHR